MRFLSGAATSIANPLAITPLTLAKCLVVAGGTTTAYSLADYVRIRKVEIWSAPSTSTTANPRTVSVDWPGNLSSAGAFGQSVRHSDTSIGISSPAHVQSRPPPGSQVALWQGTGTTTTLCALVFPADSIIDLTYDMILNDSGQAATPLTVAGATAGANYCLPLDGAGGTAVPLSYPTL